MGDDQEPKPSSTPREEQGSSEDELLRLLATDEYLFDEESQVQWERLLARGELAFRDYSYQDIALILRHTRDPIVVDRILRVLAEAIGETREHRGITREFLRRVSADENIAVNAKNKMLISAVRTLGFIGRREDSDALMPLMRHNDWMVRANATRALAKIGDTEVAKKMEEILNDRAKKLSSEEIQEDLSFREGYKAIADIKYREFQKAVEKE